MLGISPEFDLSPHVAIGFCLGLSAACKQLQCRLLTRRRVFFDWLVPRKASRDPFPHLQCRLLTLVPTGSISQAQSLGRQDREHNYGFLHRLDVPSSGLILLARSYEAGIAGCVLRSFLFRGGSRFCRGKGGGGGGPSTPLQMPTVCKGCIYKNQVFHNQP